jgi:hypothetical protein
MMPLYVHTWMWSPVDGLCGIKNISCVQFCLVMYERSCCLLLSLRYTGPNTLLHKLVGLHDIVGSVRPQSDNKAVQYFLSY